MLATPFGPLRFLIEALVILFIFAEQPMTLICELIHFPIGRNIEGTGLDRDLAEFPEIIESSVCRFMSPLFASPCTRRELAARGPAGSSANCRGTDEQCGSPREADGHQRQYLRGNQLRIQAGPPSYYCCDDSGPKGQGLSKPWLSELYTAVPIRR